MGITSFSLGKEYDKDRAQHKEASWIETNGPRFQPLPEVFCMSWHWPKWWGVPSIFTKGEPLPSQRIPVDPAKREQFFRDRQTFYRNGLPMRLLRFPSGTEVWQLLTPVHGFDAPGASLPEPNQTHTLSPTEGTTMTTIQLARVVGPGHSAFALALTKLQDGSYEFTDRAGNTVRTHSNEDMRKLFEAVSALT